MLTRRSFLKIAAATLGSAVATACTSKMPVPTASAPTPVPTATFIPTRTSIPTLTPTATESPTATAAFTPTVVPSTPTATPKLFASTRGNQFYYGDTLFPIRGFNYYPQMHPWRTFNMGEWDPAAVKRDLELGASLGSNVVRTFIDYPYSLGSAPGQPIYDQSAQPVDEYLANIDEFLDIAGRVNLKVIVTLFDSLDWAVYQPQNQWIAEQYLESLIPHFANDPRIFCWDLQNEPDRAIATVGADAVISFFKRIATRIRQMDASHLQTIGWIDRARGKFMNDLDIYLDFWCFHFYDDLQRLTGLLQYYRNNTTKPVMLEEFGLATGGPGVDGKHTETDQSTHYSTVFALLQAYQMCGSVFWTLLDFPQGLAGNPPLPGDSPENHFGIFRLDYSAKPVASDIRRFWL